LIRWTLTLHFDSVDFEENGVRVALSSPDRSEFAFTVRIHHPKFVSGESGFPLCMPVHTDNQWSGEEVLEIPY